MKYVKKRLEAQESLKSRRVPSCRFWFFRVVEVAGRNLRRRGKPLVETPFIEESDDRNQQYRCQVRREQPFRSTSNDVAQVCNRWVPDITSGPWPMSMTLCSTPPRLLRQPQALEPKPVGGGPLQTCLGAEWPGRR